MTDHIERLRLDIADRDQSRFGNRELRASLCYDLQTLLAERDSLAALLAEAEGVLDWYAEAAEAVVRNGLVKNNLESVEAIFTQLALDGGTRGRSLLSKIAQQKGESHEG